MPGTLLEPAVSQAPDIAVRPRGNDQRVFPISGYRGTRVLIVRRKDSVSGSSPAIAAFEFNASKGNYVSIHRSSDEGRVSWEVENRGVEPKGYAIS